jgi:Domain of unknown function (DUF4926)
MDFEQFDTVILKEPLLGKNVRVGAIGAILDILDDDVFLVEFADRSGVAYAIEVLQAYQLLKVYEEPVLV